MMITHHTGESDSHSLLFEARHGWTGLLVEPLDTGLLYRHRKVGTLLTVQCIVTSRMLIDSDKWNCFPCRPTWR